MRSLVCAILISLSFLLVACGGGGGGTPPPPPTGGFTAASLKGQYAFSMSGVDPTGAYIARIGSFTADGAGNIITGLEDVLPLAIGQSSIASFTSGTYQIQANGRGLMVLNAAGGTGLQLNFNMQSHSGGFLLETDLNASTSGTFQLQTPANFADSSLLGHYVFSLAGVSFGNSNVAPISMIGEIASDGNGSIAGGVMDTNDGTVGTPSGATAVSAASYQLDTSGNGSNFGRGTMSFAGRSYAFYIVDSTHFLLLEEDGLGGSSGDALQQSSSVPTQNSQFTGSYVFLSGGASILANQDPDARVGRFNADGNGGLTSITLDDNLGGTRVHLSSGSSLSDTNYSIDTTVSGSGRGTFTFKDSGAGTFSDVFYLISPSQGVVQDTSKGIIATGPMYAQTSGPFTLNNLAGNYVFNWSGVQLGSSTAVPFEEDFIGQYSLASTTNNSVSGVIDYVELGLSSNSLFSNVGLSGNLVINGDGTADNKYTYILNNSPSTTIHFQVYFADTSTALLITADNSRTTAGVLKLQSAP